ncbi:hypothetical protein QCA50_001370 [Cerrena zonata]|uniref:RNA helicase n=1 Tax=Cerrena zonata TaxID=2478898 RepID=A0AAW0GT42_9APHY
MEAFQLLSRGGAKFNKKRFENDVKIFNKDSKKVDKGKGKATDTLQELPSELDFFKYAQNTDPNTKRKRADDTKHTSKKQKIPDDDEDEDEDSSAPSTSTAMPRQRVTAKGQNVPQAIESFPELAERYEMNAQFLKNLEQNGYGEPTGIQAHGIPILHEGRDLAAISPTGTGKTLAYLLPILSLLGLPAVNSKADVGNGVRAIILAPTRELAHQIHNECLKLAQGRKWRVVLFSKATANALNDKNVRDKVDMIISTPLRLVSAIQSGQVELSNVRHLVLDEADRMLDTEFLDQVQEIVAGCSREGVQKGRVQCYPSIRVVVGLKDTPLPLITQSLTYVADDFSKLPTLLQYLAQPYNPPVLIFVSSQERASSLAEELVLSGTRNVDHLHAGMTQKEREDAVSRMRRGESWVMVTTEVMARGMDFKGVREVINYDFPQSVQSYVHRIGRTGRMGREGKAGNVLYR